MHIPRRVLLALMTAALAGCSESSAAQARPPAASAAAQPAFPMMIAKPLMQGTQVGKSMFKPGDTAGGGQGQTVDGISAAGMEALAYHIHAHLSLFYRGRQIAIPAGIGIVAPREAGTGFVGGGSAFYWIHTHDATGIIHIESPVDRRFTLGQFFDIWGEPLDAGDVAGLDGKVRAFVDGVPYSGDPRAIKLRPHVQITLEVGSPLIAPPAYSFPKGL